jgi:phage shock protein A
MFENLRQAFREAVDNFRTELRRDQVPEAADRLLRAMQVELVNARAELDRLTEDVEKAREEAKREEEEARTCLRREEMARGIGDQATVEVARRYAARHLKRKDVLEEKARVLAREVEVQRREVEDMTSRLKEARLQRESLAASAGRSDARNRLQEADELFEEMDRMADRIRDLEGRADAAREIDELDLDRSSPAAPPPTAEEIDARLEELKKRMNQDG